jgi:hypothetical protein
MLMKTRSLGEVTKMADEIDFANLEGLPKVDKYSELDIFGGSTYIKTPEVGQSIEIEVTAIEEDKNPKRVSKEGKEFTTGFKNKQNEIISYDLVGPDGSRFNMKSAMLYYGIGNKLTEYKKKHPGLVPSYSGAKLRITHLFDGSHANTKPDDLRKIKEFKTMEETMVYQAQVKLAMKEFRIYRVELLN